METLPAAYMVGTLFIALPTPCGFYNLNPHPMINKLLTPISLVFRISGTGTTIQSVAQDINLTTPPRPSSKTPIQHITEACPFGPQNISWIHHPSSLLHCHCQRPISFCVHYGSFQPGLPASPPSIFHRAAIVLSIKVTGPV